LEDDKSTKQGRNTSNPEEEELSKEMQIALLKEKLTFTEKQLTDKDLQLEHYKQLVKTLRDILTEMSGKQKQTTPPVANPVATPAAPVTTPSARPPPPGFDEPATKTRGNSYKIAGRKVKSFHGPEYYSKEDEPFTITRGGGIASVSEENNHHEKTVKPHVQEAPVAPPMTQSFAAVASHVAPPVSTGQNTSGSVGSRLSKSQSLHSGIHNLVADEEEGKEAAPSGNHNGRSLRSSVSSVDTKNKQKTMTVEEATNRKKGGLTKSVSMPLLSNLVDTKFPELDQMQGQIYALSKYQQGCRFLQKKLDESNPENTKVILEELLDHVVELMTDPFGNYLFSKLMEHCDQQQRHDIVEHILPDIMATAFDMYGTQSLQKMIPYLGDEEITSVVNALKDNAMLLIKHNKANYLVQFCLDHLSTKHNQWVYDAVGQYMEEIGRDRVGCVIVKRCIDHASPEQKTKLVEEATTRALALVQDPFGNYVVQYILEKFPYEEKSNKLIRQLLGNVSDLCTQKFSSNVIEKCLKVADVDTRNSMLEEITNSDLLPQLLNDRFANFVIQTALDVADKEHREELVKNILPHLGRHYSPYSKRLQKKILQV